MYLKKIGLIFIPYFPPLIFILFLIIFLIFFSSFLIEFTLFLTNYFW